MIFCQAIALTVGVILVQIWCKKLSNDNHRAMQFLENCVALFTFRRFCGIIYIVRLKKGVFL